MKKYLKLIQQILETLEKEDFCHVPREENVDADHLVRLASSGEEGEEIIEVQGQPSIETAEVSNIYNGRSWMINDQMVIQATRLIVENQVETPDFNS